MIASRDDARRWLDQDAVSLEHRNAIRLNRTMIRALEVQRPGFGDTLCDTALETIGTARDDSVRKAIAALAIVGSAHHVSTLRGLAAHDPTLSRDVQRAVDAIEERELVAQRPPLPPGVSPLRFMVSRVVAGLLGAGVIGVTLALALFGHERNVAQRLALALAGLSLGSWLLTMALKAGDGDAAF